MKCSSIKLVDRKELKPCNLQNDQTDSPSFVITKGSHRGSHNYTFRFIKSNLTHASLSVINIMLPENIESFNTGGSLTRWANKRPRLKSSKSDNKRHELREESSETNFDVSVLLDEFIDDVYSETNFTTNEESSGCNYNNQVDPDIERLLQDTRDHEQDEGTPIKNTHKHKKHKKRDRDGNNNDKAKKKKKQKTIKFSLSKPASPTTEQIIRVDVTSNYSVEEIDNTETNRTGINGVDCSKEHARKILHDRSELKRDLDESQSKSFDDGVDDFVVQCRKLVLNDRKP